MNLKKIIADNAPSGATGFTYEPDLSAISFWRWNDGVLESWSDDDNCWLTYENAPSSYLDFMKSTIKPL